jgi:hypothetical protein
MGRGRAEFGRPASSGLQLWRQEGDRPCSLDFSSNLHPGFAEGGWQCVGALLPAPLSIHLLRKSPVPFDSCALNYLKSTLWVDSGKIYVQIKT